LHSNKFVITASADINFDENVSDNVINEDAKRVDESATVSVVYRDGKLSVVPYRVYFSSVVAWGQLINKQQEDGWMHLEISTHTSFPDHVQAEAAGFAEGYLTRNIVYEYYKEFFSTELCKDIQGFCDWLRIKVKENNQFISSMVERADPSDEYWHITSMFYKQIDGLKMGWTQRNTDLGLDIPEDFDVEYGFDMINYMADLWDYMEIFKMEKDVTVSDEQKTKRPTCSVMIKYVPEAKDLYVGHNAWHEYQAMGYRFLKKYNLPYKRSASSDDIIPGHTMSMSSYAGTIFSLDDFVVLSSGLVSTETTLNIYDKNIYKSCDHKKQVFEPARVMTANRLATSGKIWTDLIARYNSGTYNNQWMVIDYNMLKNGNVGMSDLLWVYEQLPGLAWASDQTHMIRRRGYWGSYNRAFYKDAFEASGAANMTEQYGDYFSYKNTVRAKIMSRDHVKIKNKTTMAEFMRYNDFENDEFAQFEGCSKPNPAGSIANRLDIALPDSECEISEFDPMLAVNTPYGALDMKFTTKAMAGRLEFMAVAGPTHNDKMPPFDWNTTKLTNKPYFAPIKRFDFQPARKIWGLENLDDAITNQNNIILEFNL
jgi:hypothetical protein